MKCRFLIAPALAALGIIAGCGGRPEVPIVVAYADDSTMSCTYLRENIKGNNVRLAKYIDENEKVGRYNVGRVLVYGLPGLLAIDPNDTGAAEIRALTARNKRLGKFMNEKKCDNIPPLVPVKIIDQATEESVDTNTSARDE